QKHHLGRRRRQEFEHGIWAGSAPTGTWQPGMPRGCRSPPKTALTLAHAAGIPLVRIMHLALGSVQNCRPNLTIPPPLGNRDGCFDRWARTARGKRFFLARPWWPLVCQAAVRAGLGSPGAYRQHGAGQASAASLRAPHTSLAPGLND